MARKSERQLARQMEALTEVEAEVRSLAAGLKRAVSAEAIRRDDARIAEGLETMAELKPRYAEVRARLRGKASSPEENALRSRATDTLRAWDRVAATLTRVIDPEGTPLLEEDQFVLPADPIAAAFASAYEELEAAINGPEQSAEARAHGAHPYIALRPSRFVQLLAAAWRMLAAEGRAEGARFLEVGAGAGMKLMLAREFFDTVHGLEFDEGYVERAELVLAGEPPQCRVMQGDATVFDDYGAYDVIYSYLPMMDEDGQRAIETRISDQMRPGAVLIAPFCRHAQLWEDISHFAPDMYMKGVTPERAREIALAARRVGRDIPRPSSRPRRPHLKAPVPGLFAPVTEALARAGYRWV